MKAKLISYFSPSYAKHATKLIDSCHRWGIDHEVTKVQAFKNWQSGVMAKPAFIRRQMETFSNYDAVLWVDADAYVVRRLPIDDLIGADVACSRFQWTPSHKLEYLTGTMLFAINNATKLFVDQWVKETKAFTHSDTPEQDSLAKLIPTYKNMVGYRAMDIEWTWIHDERVKAQFPTAIPIIVHTQASRQTRAEEYRRDQAKP
jgi:hypothetical protein